MTKFLFLYKGFEAPTPEIGRAWMDWFASVGDRMIEPGNPMSGGFEVTPGAVTPIEVGADSFSGYSIIEVDSKEAALELAKTNPMITSVVVYELGSM